ncbi:formimidoylglutamate deiminase [Lapillicoccus jejuensis]|uniref:Formiminoglutamate deiminase n=1 Tax=Lapillicoccus jejuensis TaxID=402171 RepID=A0A542DZX9_9MICO|nr:formimidoylglutamate deiminase [Lapillicoccus jejuensis]TQJ08599.1 formiminoglutamate deiminase [Lapillicoccus jejuensis]
MSSTTYFAEHALLPAGAAVGVRVHVEGDRITEVSTNQHLHHDDVVLPGVLLPGLANTHSHAFHRALRGRSQGSHGSFWTWRQQMYDVALRLSPDTYLALARATYAEMVLSGMTAVGEFHYVHHTPVGRPYADPHAMGEALVHAASDAGIRLTLLDTLYLTGGLTGEGHVPLEEEQRRFTDGSVDAWAARLAGRREVLGSRPGVTLGAAVHSVRAVPREDLRAAATAVDAVDAGMPVHVHLSEQPAENVATSVHYGRTPTELLDEAGLLRPTLTAVHATHLTERDIALLGDAETMASFCPTTERDLADGIGPARALADAGAHLTLGSDQHAVIDPFEEIRGLEMHERLATNERGRFSPEELLDAASVDGYRSLGVEDGGAIAPGRLADFVAVRDDTVRTMGARPAQILYCATAADVDTVVVGGHVVVDRGEHVRLGPVGPLYRDAFDLLRDDL